MPQSVDPDKVAWFAPETLHQEEFAQRLADAETAEEALEILRDRPTTGEYRVQADDLVLQDGPDGTTLLGPNYGDLVVWVNTTPEDNESGDGEFEVYDPSEHGENYQPTIRRDS